MKKEQIHEGCTEQIQRLFKDKLYNKGAIPTDEKGRIRIDDLEMRSDVQTQVATLWTQASTEALPAIGDLDGYKKDFFNLFGFEVDGVEYEKEVDEMIQVPGLV